MKLTKKFIKENSGMTLKEAFPEVFEAFTGWVKDKNEGRNIDWIGYVEKDILIYGIASDNVWFDKSGMNVKSRNNRPATPQEIKDALEKEAVRRGYKDSVTVKPLWETPLYYWNVYDNQVRFEEKSNTFYFGCCIFKDGVWATIIQTITKQEAEERLGMKII